MTTRSYPHGVPSWIDTRQPDVDATCRFYGELFGWSFTDAMPPDVPGRYVIATLDDQDVAAIATSEGDRAIGWMTYVAVDDADAVAAAAPGAGGRVVVGAADAGPAGRGAELVDPAGARFGIWQAGRRAGAQLVNVPGTWNFSDLLTPDPDGARGFYATLFGWESDPPRGEAPVMWRVPGYGAHLAATVDPGIHERQAAVHAPPSFADAIAWLAQGEPGLPARWDVIFSVAERDASLARAVELGATDVSGPVDTEWTRTATIRDPQGAVLTLSEFTPPGG